LVQRLYVLLKFRLGHDLLLPGYFLPFWTIISHRSVLSILAVFYLLLVNHLSQVLFIPDCLILVGCISTLIWQLLLIR